MRKFLGSLFLLAALVTSGLAVSSCIINSEEASEFPQPTVANQDGGTIYTISFPSNIGSKKMKYANVIRLSCDSSDFSSTVTRTNIGQVFPTKISDQPSTYQFWDPNTATGGTYYKYLIRYFNGSIYQYTNATEDTYPGLNTSEAVLTGSPEIDITVDEQLNTWKIELSTAVTFPSGFDSDSELAVVISNGTDRKSFTIASKDDAENNTAESVDLQRILSEDFLDRKITVLGVVGIRKTIKNETLSQEYTTYNWTNQKDITINWSWKDATGNPQTIDPAETSLTVPSVTNPDNQFDLNPNRISLNASIN